MSAQRQRILGIIVFGIALVISLVVGEAVSRTFVRLPLQRVLPEVTYHHHPVRRFTLQPDQQAFTYGVPVRIDERAFRRTGEQRPGQRADILALGDSFTFGMGVRDDETWPAQLKERLERSVGREIAVVNAGTISYGIFQELDLLRASGLATRPRVVVHALYWNDFMNAGPPPPNAPRVVDQEGYLAWDKLGRPRGAVQRTVSSLMSSSALLFGLRQAVTAIAGGGTESSYGAAYAAFLERGLTVEEWKPIEAFYRDLKALSDQHGFQVVSVVMPVSGIVERGDSPETHPYAVAARELLTRLQVPHIDASYGWKGRKNRSDAFLPQGADAHLNAEGYRLVSDALAEKILGEPALRGALKP